MKQIYLVRHCQATGQEAAAQLTETGIQQAEQLVSFFEDMPIDRIVSSPFHRAIATIQPVATKRSIPIELDQRLEERVLSSQHMDDWLDRLRDTFQDLSLCYEGGESSLTAMQRASKVVDELLITEDQHIVIVSHGGLLSLLLKSVDDRFGFSEWQQMSNPDVFFLTCTDTERHIKRIWG
ncbi:histidine phosphatase family protein [Brevibacillus sp. SIMBA_040]|uniref:histidine phosphatase family protein n=1 Tax=unclassified Brevibacillus TaxID=2684853 RepID=UPI00397A9C3A